MKKEILKRLLAKPGEEHSVSEFDARYTGDLTKSEAEALLAENIGKLSSLQDIRGEKRCVSKFGRSENI